MRAIVFSVFISVSLLSATAQSVVSTAAGGSEIVMWTIGELVTESIVRSDGYFTQGFNQAFEAGPSGIIKVDEDKISFKAYPNPVADRLNLFFEEGCIYSWRLYDPEGKLIRYGEATGKDNIIDLSGNSRGKYILKIAEGSKVRSVVIIKN